MYDVSTVRSPASRERQATIFDACPAAVARSLWWLIAAIGREMRVRRDMRQVAAMDDHMLEDIGVLRYEVEYRVRHGRD